MNIYHLDKYLDKQLIEHSDEHLDLYLDEFNDKHLVWYLELIKNISICSLKSGSSSSTWSN